MQGPGLEITCILFLKTDILTFLVIKEFEKVTNLRQIIYFSQARCIEPMVTPSHEGEAQIVFSLKKSGNYNQHMYALLPSHVDAQVTILATQAFLLKTGILT